MLPLTDWVGFNVNAPFAECHRITGAAGSGDKARESLRLPLASGVAHRVRTTVGPALLDEAAVKRMGAQLAALGATQQRADRPKHA